MSEIPEKKKNELPKKNFGCLYLFIVMGILALSPWLCNAISVLYHQAIWYSHSINSYEVEFLNIGYAIFDFISVVVIDGNPELPSLDQISSDDLYYKYGQMSAEEYERNRNPATRDIQLHKLMQGSTIENIFNEAYSCVILCTVSYDSQYGYPNRISKGFIEGGWVEISIKPIK